MAMSVTLSSLHGGDMPVVMNVCTSIRAANKGATYTPSPYRASAGRGARGAWHVARGADHPRELLEVEVSVAVRVGRHLRPKKVSACARSGGRPACLSLIGVPFSLAGVRVEWGGVRTKSARRRSSERPASSFHWGREQGLKRSERGTCLSLSLARALSLSLSLFSLSLSLSLSLSHTHTHTHTHTHRCRRGSGGAGRGGRACSTMKARSLSRSMFFPDEMWSASTNTYGQWRSSERLGGTRFMAVVRETRRERHTFHGNDQNPSDTRAW